MKNCFMLYKPMTMKQSIPSNRTNRMQHCAMNTELDFVIFQVLVHCTLNGNGTVPTELLEINISMLKLA
jgi:hypothetical protein